MTQPLDYFHENLTDHAERARRAGDLEQILTEKQAIEALRRELLELIRRAEMSDKVTLELNVEHYASLYKAEKSTNLLLKEETDRLRLQNQGLNAALKHEKQKQSSQKTETRKSKTTVPKAKKRIRRRYPQTKTLVWRND
jgi:hypothetical protein